MATSKKKKGSRGAPPPSEMLGLPERLKRAMKNANQITQKGLEEISGVSQSSISSLRNGHSLGSATMATVVRLAVALDADLKWLVLGEGDDFPRMVAAAKAGGVAVLDESRAPNLVPPARAKQPTPRKKFPRQV